MIQYDDFALATPPRSGASWFAKAVEKLGLTPIKRDAVWTPPPRGHEGFVVTLVRHPFDWLVSLYQNQPAIRYFDNGPLNQIVHFASISPTFPQFIKTVADCPNKVANVFDAYQSNTTLRLEDFPWSPMEFFESFGYPSDRIDWLRNFQPQMVTPGHKMPQDRQVELKKMIVKSERDFCDRYDFW